VDFGESLLLGNNTFSLQETDIIFLERYEDEHHSSIINTRQYRGPEAGYWRRLLLLLVAV
jgi:hypothetical protein